MLKKSPFFAYTSDFSMTETKWHWWWAKIKQLKFLAVWKKTILSEILKNEAISFEKIKSIFCNKNITLRVKIWGTLLQFWLFKKEQLVFGLICLKKAVQNKGIILLYFTSMKYLPIKHCVIGGMSEVNYYQLLGT